MRLLTKTKFWLALILFLAISLRFYQLTGNPPSLNWDEVSHGYNAYSILKTGADEWGKSWPTIFRAYGDYKLPVYIYLTSASIFFFGFNEFAIRFPSALVGFLAVLFTYLLVKKLTKNDLASLLSAFFLAISPWHIFLSRPAFEANLASFLVITGVYFLFLSFKKRWFLLLSFLFLGLSIHAYNSARIFTPLILLLIIYLYLKEFKTFIKVGRKQIVLAVLILLLFFLPFLKSFTTGEGLARFKWVSVIDQGAINRINMARGSSDLPAPLPRLIHNKVTYFVPAFYKNYLTNLSPVYLFWKGGTNYQYNILGQPVIFPIQLPLILAGLFWLFKNWSRKENKLIVFWWLLAIIPAATTQENPHVLRTILVLPMPQIIASLGFVQIWVWLKKKTAIKWLFTVVYVLLLAFFFFKFIFLYFNDYKRDYSWSWQYGYKQAVDFIKNNGDQYDQVFVTKKYGEPHEFLLFYLQWPPSQYRHDANLNRYFQTDWYWVDSFDKFVFINDWEVKDKLKEKQTNQKQLLITSPDNYNQGWEKLETIRFLDGKIVFEILER